MFSQDQKVKDHQSGKKPKGGSFFSAKPIQAKLKVNEPNDAFEQEADRVANQVISGPDSPVTNPIPPVIQRKCEACEEEELNRKENSAESPAISREMEGHIGGLPGRGRAMNRAERSFFEPRFGRDFSSVRIHENDPSAEKINARAYTTGNHIVFNQNESPSNQKLMAHELTHVVQQGGGRRSAEKRVQRQEVPQQVAPVFSQEERNWLYIRLTSRMSMAYTKFVDACNSHQRHLRDLASQNVDVATLVLDVALTFATPGIGGIIRRGLTRGMASEASTLIHQVASRALSRADELTSAATTIGKDLAKRGFQTVFNRSEEEQFVEDLKQIMSESMDAIHGNLPYVSDEQLSILYFNYDPSIATLTYYVNRIGEMIRNYRNQIMPIGQRTDGAYGINRLRWIEGRSRRALALTGEGRYYNVGGGVRLLAFISPYFQPEAIRRNNVPIDSIPVIHYGALESGSSFGMLPEILDSPSFTDNMMVFRPPTGVPAIGGNSCPSCHGDSGRPPSSQMLDMPSFFENQNPNPSPELLEWLRQGQ